MFDVLHEVARRHRPAALAVAVAALACPFASVADTHADATALAWTADDPALEWGPCPDFMPEDCRVAVLRGDPAEPDADIFFRLPGGTTAERHWHSSAERMVLVSGEMHVVTDGQDPVVMTPGTYGYMPARLPHSAECRSTEPCILYIAFDKPVDATPGAPD